MLSEEKKPYLGRIIIQLLANYPDLKTSLQASFPTIYADLESASTNPNCSCRGKIVSYLSTYINQAEVVFKEFLAKHPNDEAIIEAINTDWAALTPKTYAGKMFEIKNTQEAYAKLIQDIQKDRANYKAISTAINGEKLFVYFA